MGSWLKGYMRNIITDFNTHPCPRTHAFTSHSKDETIPFAFDEGKVIKGVLFSPSGYQATGVTSTQRRSQIVFKG